MRSMPENGQIDYDKIAIFLLVVQITFYKLTFACLCIVHANRNQQACKLCNIKSTRTLTIKTYENINRS